MFALLRFQLFYSIKQVESSCYGKRGRVGVGITGVGVDCGNGGAGNGGVVVGVGNFGDVGIDVGMAVGIVVGIVKGSFSLCTKNNIGLLSITVTNFEVVFTSY